MKTVTAATVLGAASIGLILAGCAATGGGSTGLYGSAPSTSSAPSAANSGKDLSVGPSALGKIVVDGKGMTAYFFDKDTPNSATSACTAQCAKLWPAITTTSATPTVSGLSGTVATITGTAGGKQITIDGRPIYRYSADTAPGDTRGQGVGGVWYVISPAGTEITSSRGGY